MASKKEGDFNLRILVCGKTGVGKSSLINSIFGCEVCRVVDPGSKDGSLDPCTTQLQKTEVNLHGILVTIYDSPGLQDGTDNEERYLQEMHDTCKDVDIVIYCIDMTITRYAVPEIRSSELITERFGKEFWERCVFVMTKANCVWVPRDRDPLVYHKNLYKNLSQAFRSHLMKQGVSSSIANSIPAVAAGRCDYHAVDESISQDERYVWYVSDQSYAKERTDFLSELWVTLFKAAGRCSVESRHKFVAATAQDDRIEALDKGSASTLQELLQNVIKQLRENGDYAVKMVADGHNYRPVRVQLDNRQIYRMQMRAGSISRWTMVQNEMVTRWSRMRLSRMRMSRRRWGVLIAIVVGTIGVGLWLWLGYPDSVWDSCWYRYLSTSYMVSPVLSFLGSLSNLTNATNGTTNATNATSVSSQT